MARVWVCVAVVVLGVAAAAAAAGGGGQGGEGGEEGPRPRRAPSGFLGMRGKKEAPPPPMQAGPAPSEDMMPGLYQLDMPLRGKKTPSGFLGMRGKKSEDEDEDMDEEEEEAVYGRPALDSDFNFLLKRAPSGFLGMRGKKAPSGFLGMRGKKAGFEGYMQPSAPASPRQALLSLLQGQGLGDAAPLDDDYYYYMPEAWRTMGTHKRAPSGFLGMRGKKGAAYQDKRAPSGFLGMRG